MRRMLLIGVEETVRELVRSSLEEEDCRVHAAVDGYEAIEMVEALRPEIALTDMEVPELGGIEVLRHLKEVEPDLEVIVLAKSGELSLAVQALELGASDFIVKPINQKAFAVALQRAEEKIWMRRKLQEAMDEINKRYDFEHKLIQTSMDGIIANDRAGKILVFNQGATRIYGYTSEEAHEIHVTELYPQGGAQTIKRMIYGPEYGGAGRLINYETLALTKEKELVPILLSATLMYEGGVEVATVGYFKDLTDIKRRIDK
jgi:two-component system NtrC family sensor kinase